VGRTVYVLLSCFFIFLKKLFVSENFNRATILLPYRSYLYGKIADRQTDGMDHPLRSFWSKTHHMAVFGTDIFSQTCVMAPWDQKVEYDIAAVYEIVEIS